MKVISTQQELLQIKNLCKKEQQIAFDIETTGLDYLSDKIIIFQIKLKEANISFIIDGNLIYDFKDILESKQLIIHNALFELTFLNARNIYPTNVYDTLLAEMVLYMGENKSVSLSSLCERYLSVYMDKTYQTLFSYITNLSQLTKEHLDYALLDVEYLFKIKEIQERNANYKDVTKAIKLENDFVIVLSYISICGMKLDKEKWIKKTKSHLEEFKKIEDEILTEVWTNPTLTFLREQQLNIFNENKLSINLDSNKDISVVCKKLGLDITSLDDPSKESVDDTVLSQYKDIKFIDLLLQRRKSKKSISTYGLEFLENIHPKTGRIHTRYKQMVASGRTVSSSPNLNNIPRDKETRECFVSEPGNTLINADYSDQEGRLFANYSGEPNLISFYKGDFSDGHSYVAKLCFREELKDIPMEEVKKKRPDLRAKAKTARFAIYYGGVGATISKNLKISIEEGEEIYNKYLKAFPKLAEYFNKVRSYTERHGYILVSPITRRKVFNPKLKHLPKDSYERYDFLKKSLNYPIQGSSAEMSKIALIIIYKKIKSKGLLGEVKIIGFVYDEIILEVPIELSKEFSNIVKESMEFAARLFCKYVAIPVEPEIAPYWKH